MPTIDASRVFTETRVRRDEARALLRALMDAKAQSGGREVAVEDSVASVTGRSSMDRAIETTRGLIDSFNRVLDDLRRGMTDEDLALLAEIEAEHGGA